MPQPLAALGGLLWPKGPFGALRALRPRKAFLGHFLSKALAGWRPGLYLCEILSIAKFDLNIIKIVEHFTNISKKKKTYSLLKSYKNYQRLKPLIIGC